MAQISGVCRTLKFQNFSSLQDTALKPHFYIDTLPLSSRLEAVRHNTYTSTAICEISSKFVFSSKGNEVSIASYLTAILIVKVVWRRVDLPLTRLCDFGSSCSLWSPQEEVEVWIVVWMPLSTGGISADYSKYILKLLLLLQIITVSFCFFFLEIHFFTLKLLYVFVSD